MNILFDHQVFSFQQYGGVSRYVSEIARKLATDKNNRVEILAPLYINQYIENIENVLLHGMKIQRFPRSEKILIFLNTFVSKLLLKFRKDIDILHETYHFPTNYLPKGAKKVITVYDMTYEKYPELFPADDKNRSYKALKVREADHIICISENTRKDLIKFLSVPESKTSVIYLGYSIKGKKDATNYNKEKKPVILFVGERRGYKNFETLLRAFGRSDFLKNNYSIVCFGGDKPGQNELSIMAQMNLDTEKVKFLRGNDEMLSDLYSTASLFVYPSLYEGFGMPPLEAMSFGCPVVCSNSSSLPEVVGNAAEIAEASDENELLSAIERVLSSSTLANDLIERGFERLQHFSWDKCSDETMAIYNKLKA
ncbi:MAG: glycosyltransferase family 4 protein [Candidatus Riflebacteria bacterium]|nr:glycosyltransferase family 4 protein [Candidatus Riflebacteria bacterium]